MADLSLEISEISERSNTNNRSRSWFLTWNNPVLDGSQFSQCLLEFGANKYIFQLEAGNGGTPHFQGVVNFKVQKTFLGLKKWNEKIHWEVCKDWKASCDYCCKLEGRLQGPWSLGIKITKVVQRLSYEELWEGQKMIWDIMVNKFPTNRTIYWFWEPEGNIGKTEICKKAVLEIPNSIVLGGKAGDMKYGVMKFLETHDCLDMAIFHFVRSQEEYISYTGIEEISDGMFFSTKYESGMCVFDRPKIVCFANFEPDTDKCSKDRWIIREVRK